VDSERSLEERLEQVEALLTDMLERVSALEGETAQPSRHAEPVPERRTTRAPSDTVSQGPADADELEAAAVRAPSATAEERRRIRPSESFEDLLGGRILALLGGLTILIGVILFLVIAVDRGWIGVEARVAMAFLGSTLLLAAGLFLYERRGQTDAAIVAVATALASLYASLTYATAVQDVVASGVGLLVAGVIGASGALIAIRWGSQVVAALGLLGALAAPVLVDSGTSTLALAFTAIALVATVAILIWQRWGWLAIGAFLLTAPQLAFWAEDREGLLLPLLAIALYWCVFVVAAIGFELRVPTSKLRVSSASVLLVNAGFAAALGGLLIDDRGSSTGVTAWVLALTVTHIALGAFGFRQRMSAEVAGLLVAVGVGLSGITLALALDGPALVVGWSAEAVILTWVAKRTGEGRALAFATAFLALATLHALGDEAPPDALLDGVAHLGEALTATLCIGVAALVMGMLVDRRDLCTLFFATAAVAFVYAASLGIVDLLQGDEVERSQTAQVALSAFWAGVGLVAIVVGLVRDIRELRFGGLVLLLLGVAKLFAYDLAELEQLYRVLSFIAVGLVLLAGAYAYQRVRSSVTGT
jgi:uncharacterized membrane protein